MGFRRTHKQVRNYVQPIFLVTTKEKMVNGIMTTTTTDKLLIYANVIEKQVNVSSDFDRPDNYDTSIVIPNPPKRIDARTQKILINDKQYMIKSVNYNFLSKGDIQISCIFEQDIPAENLSLSNKLEFKIYG